MNVILLVAALAVLALHWQNRELARLIRILEAEAKEARNR